MVRTGLLAFSLAAILAGCGDSPRPLEPNVAQEATILPASPPTLYAAPGSRIPAPTVVVHDRDGRALAGVRVHFTVSDGRGYVTDPLVTTDAGGKASAGSWVLDSEEGVHVLLATVAGVAAPLVLVAKGGLKPALVSYGLARLHEQGCPLGLGGFYILYEDNTFARAYLSADLHGNVTTRSDAGLFTRADSSITFLESVEHPRFSSWTGTVRGDSMFILNPSDLSLEVYAGAPPVNPYGAFPPVSGPARVYNRVTEHRYPPGSLSRYVLYGDSTFALQYLGPAAEYTGRYRRTGSAVDFSFNGWSTATGILHGDSLVVEYSIMMWLSDFEDGVYRLEPGHPTNAPHLFVARADGSVVTRLVPGSWPAWSPDGRRIALQRDGEIHLINADGSDEARVSEGEHPAWSPDGTRIVFTNGEGIAVMASDGSAVTTVLRHDFRDDTYAPGDMGVGKPAWSPDGERIAFEHLGDGDLQPAQIYIMNADGSDPRRITMSPDGRRYAESDPAWSPDGSRIVFWSYGYGIATVSASGGVPSSAYNHFPAVAYGARPRWSPDGSTIAFTAHTASTVAPAIWVVPAGGGSASVLVPGGHDAAWSPDGEKIVFVSTRHD